MWSAPHSNISRRPIRYYPQQVPGINMWNDVMMPVPAGHAPRPPPYVQRNAIYEPLHPHDFTSYDNYYEPECPEPYYDSGYNKPDLGGGMHKYRGSGRGGYDPTSQGGYNKGMMNGGADRGGMGMGGGPPMRGHYNGSNPRGGFGSNRGSYSGQNPRGSYNSGPSSRGSFNSGSNPSGNYRGSNPRGGFNNGLNSRGSFNNGLNTRGGFNSGMNTRGGYVNSRGTFNNRGTFSRGRGNSSNYMGNNFNSQLYEPKPKSIDLATYTAPPIVKEPFAPSVIQVNRDPEVVRSYREEHKLSLIGTEIPPPILELSDYQFPDYILSQLAKNGIETPTPIQSQTWPVAMGGRDFIGISQTGSGKTLAFMLPAILHINQQPKLQPGEGPLVLVMAPTRELANQILTVSKLLGATTNIRSTCVYGGASRIPQIQALRMGVEIIIATPGRLIDFLNAEETNLVRCSYLVLDEADRMLDMGFEPQIRQILSKARPDRQTLMFSATWPTSVQALGKTFLKEHVQLNVGSVTLSANPDIQQIIHVCHKNEAESKLFEILEQITSTNQRNKVLMFINTKKECNNMCQRISMSFKGRFFVDVIHGDKSQNARDYTLRRFRNGPVDFLIATEVAARGIDVTDITHVINYGFPNDCEQYVHRIGRTARQGRKGEAHTLVFALSPHNCSQLITILNDAQQTVSPQLYRFLNQHQRKPYYNKFAKY